MLSIDSTLSPYKKYKGESFCFSLLFIKIVLLDNFIRIRPKMVARSKMNVQIITFAAAV
jgi:hypothetical protein